MRIRSMPSLFGLLSAVALLGTSAQASPRDHGRHGGRGYERGMALPQGPGRLINNARGMCLDVQGRNGLGNGNVRVWDCNGDLDQVWSFSGDAELVNAADGRVLDAAGRAGQRGVNVDVFPSQRKKDQRWELVPRGPNSFELVNRKRGMCLDVAGREGARGDNVMLWDCDGGADQAWSFQPVSQPAPVVAVPVSRPPPPMQPMPMQPMPMRPMPPPPSSAPPIGPVRPMPVVAPGPVVAPVPRPINPLRFQALLRAVDSESFSQGKLTVISQAASDNLFRVSQVDEVVRRLGFSGDKLRALDLLAPKVIDRENAFRIYDAFTFGADKEKARQILRRHGY